MMGNIRVGWVGPEAKSRGSERKQAPGSRLHGNDSVGVSGLLSLDLSLLEETNLSTC